MAEEQQQPLAPHEQAMLEKRRDIVLPSGQMGNVPNKDLEAAIQAGARLPTDQDYLIKGYEGVGGAAATSAIGSARGVIPFFDPILLGATKAIEGEQGAAQTREALSLAQAAYPTLSTGSELAGLGVGMLGAGLGKAGQAITRGGEALLGARAATIGGKLAVGAAQGAGEMYLYNVNKAFSEDALGNHQENAEKLFASAVNKDVLFGAGIGAVLHAAPTIAKALRGRAYDDVVGLPGAGQLVRRDAEATGRTLEQIESAKQTSHEAAQTLSDFDQIAKEPKQLAEKLADSYIGRVAKSPEEAAILKRSFLERATKENLHESIVEEQAQKLKKAADTALKKVDETVYEAAFMRKAKQMERLVDADKWREARDTALNVWNDAKEKIEFWEGTAAKGGAEGAVKKARKWLNDFGDDLGEMATAKDKSKVASQIFDRLDDFKRQLAPSAQFGKPMWAVPEASRDFDALYHSVRSTLEDESVWGAAGAAQKELNAAHTNAISFGKPFEDKFIINYGSEKGRPLFEMDPAKAKNFLSRIGTTESQMGERSLADYISSRQQRIDAVEKHFQLTATERANLQEGRKALKDLAATADAAKKESAFATKLRQAQLDEQAIPIGGISGLAADVVMRPHVTLGRLANAGRFIEHVNRSLPESVSEAFKPLAGALKRPALNRVAVTKQLEEIKTMAANPSLTEERISRAAKMQELIQAAPKIAGSLSTVAAKAISYLASTAPQGHTPAGFGLQKTRYSDADLAKFSLRVEAVKDPLSVVEDIRKGVLPREQIETIKAVYPTIFEQIRTYAQDEIARLEKEGKLSKMPYGQKCLISALLGVPSDDSLRPVMVQLLQEAKEEKPEQPQQPSMGATSKRPIKLRTDWTQTESSRIESRGGTGVHG